MWWSVLLAMGEASACGGFFCEPQQPVVQSAERILFAFDAPRQRIEVHVQISYQGAAEDFAWVVPTPAEPSLQLTTDDVFTRLAGATEPSWRLNWVTDDLDDCFDAADFSDTAASDPPARNEEGSGVEVVSEGTLGPYQTVVLRADDEAVLLQHLQTHGYALPDDLLDKLAPYVADESYFVALRLQKNRTTGDLAPLAMTYEGTKAQIPLQLTAIAAMPDMRLQPFILANGRAVPEDYLHVQVSPFAIDWLNAGANYYDVVSRAADVAGGQAFATEFSGSSSVLAERFWRPDQYRPGRLRTVERPTDIVTVMAQAGIPLNDGTAAIALEFFRPPLDRAVLTDNGIGEAQFLACVDCFVDESGYVVNGRGLATALDERWVAPMRHVQTLADQSSTLTRLVSSMDAAEMTLDPTFVINPELPDVANEHVADMVLTCGETGSDWFEAPSRLELADGRSMWVPWDVRNRVVGWDAWFQDTVGLPADRVERTSARGQPEPIMDFSEELAAALEGLGPEPEPPLLEGDVDEPCGCSTGRGGAWAWVVGLLVCFRRRTTASPARRGG